MGVSFSSYFSSESSLLSQLLRKRGGITLSHTLFSGGATPGSFTRFSGGTATEFFTRCSGGVTPVISPEDTSGSSAIPLGSSGSSSVLLYSLSLSLSCSF